MFKGQAVIIKIGGSLIEHGPEIIHTIRDSARIVLIIPGGGVFADTVRQRNVSDTAAHFMSIAAMDQYGWLLSTSGIPVTTKPDINRTQIFLPYLHLMKTDPLPHSWDITSDTISAYYANLLSSPLIILKSIDYIRIGDNPVSTLNEGMVTHDLDPSFIPYICSNEISGQIIRGSDIARLARLLKGEKVPGTSFGSTI